MWFIMSQHLSNNFRLPNNTFASYAWRKKKDVNHNYQLQKALNIQQEGTKKTSEGKEIKK